MCLECMWSTCKQCKELTSHVSFSRNRHRKSRDLKRDPLQPDPEINVDPVAMLGWADRKYHRLNICKIHETKCSFHQKPITTRQILILWGLNKMANVLQTTFAFACSWKKATVFWFKCHWHIYASPGLELDELTLPALNWLMTAYPWNPSSLQWRHNGRDSVSNHQPHDCLLNR